MGHPQQKTIVTVLCLVVAGFVFVGSVRTTAQPSDRAVKQDTRLQQPEKVETDRRTPSQVLALPIDGSRPTEEQVQVVVGHVFSDSERSAMVASGAKALDVLPVRADIEAIEDADKRAVMNKAVELTQRSLQAGTMTDEELESYIAEMSLFAAILQVGIDHGSGRSAGERGDQNVAAGGDLAEVTPGACTEECSQNRLRCIWRECGPEAHPWPCFCCVPCNLANIACLTACVFYAM